MRYVMRSNNPDAATNVIRTVQGLDRKKDWDVTIKRYVKKRSNEQLAYFWAGIVATVVMDTGNDKDDIHDWLCGEFFGWKEVKVMGAVKKRPVRTLTSPEPLTVEEMVNFCEWCASRLAQEGIIVEPPKGIGE